MPKTWRRLALFGPPVLIVVFELAHPVVLPPIYPAVLHHLPWWLYLHVANLAFFSLFGLAAYLLVRDVPNRAAAWSRVSIAVYVPLYASFDALVGVGTGILVQNARGLDPSGRAVAEPLIDAYWNNGILSAIAALGSIAWVIAMFASAVAFTRPERRRAAAIAAIVLFPVGGWAETNLFLPSGGHVPLSWWLVTIGIGVSCFSSAARWRRHFSRSRADSSAPRTFRPPDRLEPRASLPRPSSWSSRAKRRPRWWVEGTGLKAPAHEKRIPGGDPGGCVAHGRDRLYGIAPPGRST